MRILEVPLQFGGIILGQLKPGRLDIDCHFQLRIGNVKHIVLAIPLGHAGNRFDGYPPSTVLGSDLHFVKQDAVSVPSREAFLEPTQLHADILIIDAPVN